MEKTVLRNFAVLPLLLLAGMALAEAESKLSPADYISRWKDEAIYQMALHKIPASITLAQGLLESGNGNSRLALEGNNHFGIKCHNDWGGKKIYEDDESNGECFRKYKHAEDSFEDHSQFLLRNRYESLFKLQTDDYKAWARGLKACGYATNSKYPDLLIDLVKRYQLDRYDREGMEYIRKGKVPRRPGNKGDDSGDLPKTNVPVATGDSTQGGDFNAVTLGNQRAVSLTTNDVRFVIGKAGDTPQSIAQEMDMMNWQIRKYNELEEGQAIAEGQVIYLQPKRARGTADKYTAAAGDTWWSIAQKYAIKTKSLRKKNPAMTGERPEPGAVIRLK